MAWRVAVLDGGPFDNDSGECAYLPEHIRVWQDGTARDSVRWRDEAHADFPERAARYSLKQSVADPAVYVFDGVGDGGPFKSTRERKPIKVGKQPLRDPAPVAALVTRGPAAVYADGRFIGWAENIEWSA